MNHIRMGVLEEVQGFEIAENLYALVEEVFSKRLNASIGLVPIPKDETENFRHQGDLPKTMDVMLFPVQIDTLYSPEMKWRFTAVYDSVSTFIVSSIPKMTKKPSLSFLSMERHFSITWMVSLLAVSILLALATPKIQNGRPFIFTFVEMIWKNLLLFFFEPYSRIEKTIAWRVAAMSWLIATTFIYFEISGNLKSDFTDKDYDTVDTIDQLVKQGLKNVWFWDGTDELTSFRRKVNVSVPESSIIPIENGVIGDEFVNVSRNVGDKRKFMVVETLIIQFLLLENQQMENKIQYANKYYFSPSIENQLLGFAVSYNFSQSELMEKANLMVELITENDLTFHQFYKARYSIDLIKWKQPEDDFSTISVKEIESLLSLYYVGNVIALLALIIEIVVFLSLYFKKSRSARKISKRLPHRVNINYLFYGHSR